jgi:hypothetical protein
MSPSTLDSLLPELATRIVEAAGLDPDWIEIFIPLLHMEQLSLDEEPWIAITFGYLGESQYHEYDPDQDLITTIIIEAAESFGHSVRYEKEKFGFLQKPQQTSNIDDDPGSDAAAELRHLINEFDHASVKGPLVKVSPSRLVQGVVIVGLGFAMLFLFMTLR